MSNNQKINSRRSISSSFISFFNLAGKLILRIYKKLPLSRYSRGVKLIVFVMDVSILLSFLLSYLWDNSKGEKLIDLILIIIIAVIMLLTYLGEILLISEKRKSTERITEIE